VCHFLAEKAENGIMVFEMDIPCPKCGEGWLAVKVEADVYFTVSETYLVDEIQESYFSVVDATCKVHSLNTATEAEEQEDALWNELELEREEQEFHEEWLRSLQERRIDLQAKSALVGDYFSGCTPSAPEHPKTKILEAIATATKTIEILMYTFTDMEIATALLEQSNNGVKIRIILDKGQRAKVPKMLVVANFFKMNRIQFHERTGASGKYANGCMHHKAMIVDSELVVKGSFNYTWAAEHLNDEDLSIQLSIALAKTWQTRFNSFWNQLE